MIEKRRDLEPSKRRNVETDKRRNVETAKVQNGGRCWAVTHVLAVSFLAFAAAGCNGPWRTATHFQIAKMEEGRNRFGAYRNNMVDNAILHDMSIADFHFIPHSIELSGTGVARLDHMAPLLDTYGGIVRYETVLMDDDMIASRLEHVREYLDLTGCDMSRVELKVLLSGGRGMPASDAIQAEENVAAQQGGNAAPAGRQFGSGFSGGLNRQR